MSGPTPYLRRIELPEIDAGAPMPIVLAEENLLLFGYHVQDRTGVKPDSTCAVVSAGPYLALKFGYPNEEAIGGHRYARLGLTPNNAYEVLQSDWIDEMMRANRVHESHSDSLFAAYRHFVFVFHDSVLEFVSESDLIVSTMRGELRDMLHAEASRQSEKEKWSQRNLVLEIFRLLKRRGDKGAR